LQLIPAPTQALFAKIAADLVPGGILFNSMPCQCLYNRALVAVRRLLRVVRHPRIDALLVRAGRLVYGNKFSRGYLQARVPYMYHVPERWDGSALDAELSGTSALHRVTTFREPGTSFAQLLHSLAVLQKQDGVRPA
jgi:hypothetical protein